MNRKSLVTVAVLILLTACYVPVSATSLKDSVEEYVLENGMKFLLMERHYSPTFTGFTTFRVGGVDEQTGKTGLAHMFEHLAFKGTTVIGTKDWEKEKPLYEAIEKVGLQIELEKNKGSDKDDGTIEKLRAEMKTLQEQIAEVSKGEEFNSIYEKNGSNSLNAWTSQDFTSYIVELPSNRLELWMLMESERIKDPIFREFYKERDVVAEEKRSSETSPRGVIYEKFMAAAFDAHPYSSGTLGWMSDIQSLTRTDAELFFKKHYAPSNCVAVIVGDIDINKTKKLIDKYFRDVPSGELSPNVAVVEPEQMGEKRIEVEFDAEPQLMIGYHIPTRPDPDAYALTVLGGLLSGFDSAILDKKLVRELQIASYIIYGQGPGDRYPHLLTFSSQPIAPNTCADIEKVIYAEIEKIKREPIPERDFRKVINQLKAQFIYGIQYNSGIAIQLGYFDIAYGGWQNIDEYVKMISDVTPEQVIGVAEKYLTKKNRTVATLVKVAPEKEMNKDAEGRGENHE